MSSPTLVSRFGLGILVLCGFLPENALSASPTIVGRQAITKSIRPPLAGTEGGQVTLVAPQGPTGTRYEWDLDGNGTYERRGRSVSVRFSDNGTYRVRYRTFKSGGARNASSSGKLLRKGSKRVAIQNVAPTASAGAGYQGNTATSVRFNGKASDTSREDRNAGFTYIWNFGDGSAVRSGKNLKRPSHRYSNAGVYTVSLIVRDKDKALSSPSTSSVVISGGGTGGGDTGGNDGGNGGGGNTTPPPPISGPSTVAHPVEIQDILANPGMGWQSNDQVNTSGKDSQNLPIKVAYIKYYWKDLEPSPGNYNWSVFEQRLTQARNSGQKVAFRVVAVDNLVSAPAWLRDEGAQGMWFSYPGGPSVWTPFYGDAKFKQRHFALLQAMGQRYNNHADIDSVDIGTVGLWGEWHFGEVTPAVPMPSTADARLIIDKYFEYFPNLPKVMQLEDQQALNYAVQRGAGFRGDCIGNVQWQNRVSPPGMYDMRISGAQAQNQWKTAPVIFETCWTIQYWVNQGWNVRQIFDWALANHISAINNKNTAVPSSALGEVQRLLRYMGYRFVLKEITTPKSAHPGERITISMDWQNAGVSPSYQNHRLAFRLLNASGGEVARATTNTQVRQWLPGPIAVDESFQLPANLPSGNYTLAVGVVNPSTGNPVVQLAISGKDSAGWYPVTTIQIQ